MKNQQSIEFPITTEAEFHTALCTLVLNATINDVSPEGMWTHRCGDVELPDFDIEISEVTKPIDD
ncbi:hypothetical protein [Natronorubrum thiooxidans]|uniref:Uncharacterized protein n=1 Tax=Natronorubrum thiooxidans TaxID=308853 RepID=A0A1N7GM81_9EURY|nr:hypothetical protein [Natronorubrum thiooxidans]SIS13704.1 hypothetical protein SAMN05421752_11383 [Natronorubrum thiooxidans]